MAEENQKSQDAPKKDETADALTVTKGRSVRGERPLSIKPSSLPVPKSDPKKHYWCGVTPECPRCVIHAGGFDFPQFTQKQEPIGDSKTETRLGEAKYAGRVHAMTDMAVKQCLDGIASRVVREDSPHRDIRSVEGSRVRKHVPESGDVPLARFVYMIEVDDPEVLRPYPAKNARTLLET